MTEGSWDSCSEKQSLLFTFSGLGYVLCEDAHMIQLLWQQLANGWRDGRLMDGVTSDQGFRGCARLSSVNRVEVEMMSLLSRLKKHLVWIPEDVVLSRTVSSVERPESRICLWVGQGLEMRLECSAEVRLWRATCSLLKSSKRVQWVIEHHCGAEEEGCDLASFWKACYACMLSLTLTT